MRTKRALSLLSCFAMTVPMSLTMAVGCKSGDGPAQAGNGGSATGGTSSVGGSGGGARATGGAVGSGGAGSGGSVGSGGDNAGGSAGGMTSAGGSSGSGGSVGAGGGAKTGGNTGTSDAAVGAGGGAIQSGGMAAGGAKTGGGGGTAGGAAGNGAGGSTLIPTGGSAAGGATGSGGAGPDGSAGGSTGGGSCVAVSDFGSWPSGKGPADIGKLAVNNFKPHTGDAYTGAGYAWTFAYFGSLQFTTITGDDTNNQYLIGKFDCSQAGPSNTATASVDDRAFGDLPLEIYLENQSAACKTLGMARADTQWAKTTSDGITADARYWIDDMYMITGLQVFAYRATKDAKYLDRAAKTMQAYFTALQQADGLFWHTKQSKAYWGRANGWVASGMTELLLELPAGATRDAIMAGYKKQMDGLLPLQVTSGTDAGCWRQVLNRTDAAAESSCTAMFTFALITGVRNGWLTDAKYVKAAHDGWVALGNKTSSGGMLDKVCPGTGQANAGDLASQQKFYMDIALGSNDQHGQAPLLWAANALLRTDCPGAR
jgi:unsaturated rhamnogalacturonyl hydrolase